MEILLSSKMTFLGRKLLTWLFVTTQKWKKRLVAWTLLFWGKCKLISEQGAIWGEKLLPQYGCVAFTKSKQVRQRSLTSALQTSMLADGGKVWSSTNQSSTVFLEVRKVLTRKGSALHFGKSWPMSNADLISSFGWRSDSKDFGGEMTFFYLVKMRSKIKNNAKSDGFLYHHLLQWK